MAKENDIQKAILDYLDAKRIFHYRNNSGSFTNKAGHFYRFGAVGSPDIVCVYHGRYIGIEVKSRGGKQSPGQIEFQRGLTQAGGKYLLVDSVDKVMAYFELEMV